jgi:uncharacterized protein YpmB
MKKFKHKKLIEFVYLILIIIVLLLFGAYVFKTAIEKYPNVNKSESVVK